MRAVRRHLTHLTVAAYTLAALTLTLVAVAPLTCHDM